MILKNEDRSKILELFEVHKDFYEERVNSGIELYRKGYGKIKVVDKDGNPVKNVKIKINQKSHEFKFGANLFMLDELETPEKNEVYKKSFADVFNMATLPFYWNSTEPERGKTRYGKNSTELYRRPPIDRCIEFCEENGIEPREHALAYEQFFPDWLSDLPLSTVKAEFERRCREISERYSDKIPTIEVTNEMFWPNGKTALYDMPDYIEWCFKMAEKYFPSNQLCINEYTEKGWKCLARPAASDYYLYIENALLKGARIDAVGMQFHMFYPKDEEYHHTRVPYNPIELYKHLDLFARFQKPIHVTEVTVPAYSDTEEDEAKQAEILEKLYSLWFSHKNVEQIIYWNLIDGYAAFAPKGDMTSGENYYHGGLLRFDGSQKPAYKTLKKLITEKWHTRSEGELSENGDWTFKGFFGKYDVELETDGKTVKKEVVLSKDGQNSFNVEV